MSDWMPLTADEDEDGQLLLPFIDVIVIGPSHAVEARALVDTGTSLSVFPTVLLKSVGVNFENAITREATVGGGKAEYKLGNPSVVECEFDGDLAPAATYASDGADIVMLGMNDFLRYFDLTVERKNSRFRLAPV